MTDVLNDWEAFMCAGGLAERTITERLGVVRQLDDALAAEALTLARFIGRRELKPSSKATYYSTLNAFYRWCIAQELRTDNPLDKLPKPKRPKATPRPVSTPDLLAMLDKARVASTRAMILLAALAGLRVHEVAKVAGRDVDLTAGTLTVVGKGGHTGIIPIHPVLADLAAGMPRSGYWFTGRDGRTPVASHAVRAAISRAMDRAGVEGTPHQLRHWYGSELLASGADLRTVQELMRHQSVQSTQIYTLVPDERRRTAVAGLKLAA